MRLHQHSSLNYNNRGILVGVTDVQLFDINHTLKPELTNEEVIGFFESVGPLLGTSHNDRFLTPDNEPVGFRIDQRSFPILLNIIRERNLNRGAGTIIRNVLALVANLVVVPHGNVRFCHIQLFLHCDNVDM